MSMTKRANVQCPGCASSQSFPTQKRPHPNFKGVVVLYISCTRCPWESELRVTTDSIEDKRKRLIKMRANAIRQEKRHGAMTSSLKKMLLQTTRELHEERQQLAEKIDELRAD